VSAALLYALAGALLFCTGLFGLLARRHLLRKIIAINVMASGAFLVLIAAPGLAPGGAADPVPQAMVLTGIVVAVSATALGLGLALRLREKTGRSTLPEDHPR